MWRLVQEFPRLLPEASLSWPQFVRRVVCRDEFYLPWCYTLSEFCQNIPLAGTIRYESLETDLCRLLDRWVEVPKIGVSQRTTDWREYYTLDLARLAHTWAFADLEQFGYDWDLD